MKQSEINDYKKNLESVMTQYLASNPDPSENISVYANELPPSDRNIFPIEMFDVGAMTALLRNHKDTKDLYDVHACTIELLVTMFRLANYKLHWMEDDDAYQLAGYLSYDTPINRKYIHLLHEFIFCITRFPYNHENPGWYACLMPIFAYSKQYDFKYTYYIARYLLSTIDRYSMLANRGGHERDIEFDITRCIPNFAPLMKMCKEDTRIYTEESRYNFYKNVISEYATVFLACLFERSAVAESFGTIAKEIVALKHIEYQLTAQEYFKQKSKESLKL